MLSIKYNILIFPYNNELMSGPRTDYLNYSVLISIMNANLIK